MLASAGERVSPGRWFFGGVGIVICLGLLVRELRPFRFVISADGLDLRVPGISRLVGWAEIDALALAQPPRVGDRLPAPVVLLVPVTGSALQTRLTEQLPGDGRPARRLLEVDDVKEPVEEIAAALARFGGGRFTDLRALGPAAPAALDLTIVLRGYDRPAVDELIRQTEQALAATDPAHRQWARAQLQNANLPVAARGYDRGQVDAHLAALADRL